ncbi:unnamed protein product [Orchesella dallaii]|uniref:BTB domain-containing protein n=1 Tax=Orchesella dallaii TaxID=48710 RepID=A0ABP1RUD0_9HEXA
MTSFNLTQCRSSMSVGNIGKNEKTRNGSEDESVPIPFNYNYYNSNTLCIFCATKCSPLFVIDHGKLLRMKREEEQYVFTGDLALERQLRTFNIIRNILDVGEETCVKLFNVFEGQLHPEFWVEVCPSCKVLVEEYNRARARKQFARWKKAVTDIKLGLKNILNESIKNSNPDLELDSFLMWREIRDEALIGFQEPLNDQQNEKPIKNEVVDMAVDEVKPVDVNELKRKEEISEDVQPPTSSSSSAAKSKTSNDKGNENFSENNTQMLRLPEAEGQEPCTLSSTAKLQSSKFEFNDANDGKLPKPGLLGKTVQGDFNSFSLFALLRIIMDMVDKQDKPAVTGNTGMDNERYSTNNTPPSPKKQDEVGSNRLQVISRRFNHNRNNCPFHLELEELIDSFQIHFHAVISHKGLIQVATQNQFQAELPVSLRHRRFVSLRVVFKKTLVLPCKANASEVNRNETGGWNNVPDSKSEAYMRFRISLKSCPRPLKKSTKTYDNYPLSKAKHLLWNSSDSESAHSWRIPNILTPKPPKKKEVLLKCELCPATFPQSGLSEHRHLHTKRAPGKDCNQYVDNRAMLLYTPKLAEFKAINDVYDLEVIKAISAVLEGNEVEKDEKERCKIHMIPKYDTFFDQISISVKLNFSQGFVDKLYTIVAKPIIRIIWSLVNVRIPKARQIAQGLLDAPLKAGESSSQIQACRSVDGFPYGSEFSFLYSIILKWQEFSMGSPGDFIRPNLGDKLWNEMLLADCTIVSSDETENKCHRSVLAVHSDVLHTMLTSGLRESQTNRIEMVDVSQEGVTTLLAYMYGRDLQLDQLTIEVAFEVLKATHKYHISILEAMLLDLFCRKPYYWFSIDGLLAVYFFSVNVSEYQMLSQKMLFAMKMKPNDLRAAPLFQEMMETNPKDATNLALKLLEEK